MVESHTQSQIAVLIDNRDEAYALFSPPLFLMVLHLQNMQKVPELLGLCPDCSKIISLTINNQIAPNNENPIYYAGTEHKQIF